MRFKNQPSHFSDAHLVALIDIWPPTVLKMLRWPAMASNMSWNLFIHIRKLQVVIGSPIRHKLGKQLMLM
jgi:hypothetical protein